MDGVLVFLPPVLDQNTPAYTDIEETKLWFVDFTTKLKAIASPELGSSINKGHSLRVICLYSSVQQ